MDWRVALILIGVAVLAGVAAILVLCLKLRAARRELTLARAEVIAADRQIEAAGHHIAQLEAALLRQEMTDADAVDDMLDSLADLDTGLPPSDGSGGRESD